MKVSLLGKIAHLFLLLSAFQCDSPSPVREFESLVFGHFFGFCQGEECIETFQLSQNTLFEDTLDNYQGTREFVALSSDKYDVVQDLEQYIPTQLLALPDSTFGCPDCADQGGVFIEIHQGGNSQIWRIDQNKDQVPAFLHELLDQVNAKIALINQ